jgi:hypothetical protein
MEPKVLLQPLRSPALDYTLSQMNPVHTFTFYFPNINVILKF